MAISAAPTKASLVREALSSVGKLTDYHRAISQWFEEIKTETAKRRKWDVLEETGVLTPTVNNDALSLPTNYSEVLRVVWHRGDNKGVSQLIAGGTITLAATESLTEAESAGRLLFIFSGSTVEFGRITSYSSVTKQAVLNFTPTITGTPSYMVGKTTKELNYEPYDLKEPFSIPGATTSYSIYSNALRLDRGVTETNTALVIDYYADMNLIDEASPAFARILREWRMVFLHGIKYRSYLESGDSRASLEFAAFETATERLMKSDGRKKQPRRNLRWKSPGGLPRRRNF